ncbi:MAG: hypothetical protein ACRCYT_06320 [Cetobacterium sp.]
MQIKTLPLGSNNNLNFWEDARYINHEKKIIEYTQKSEKLNKYVYATLFLFAVFIVSSTLFDLIPDSFDENIIGKTAIASTLTIIGWVIFLIHILFSIWYFKLMDKVVHHNQKSCEIMQNYVKVYNIKLMDYTKSKLNL